MLDYVLIELGGKPRKLKFDFNAITDVETLMGGVGITTLLVGGSFRALRALVWGGLKHAYKNLMPYKVGEWLQEYMEAGGTYSQLMELVMKALELGKILATEDAGTEAKGDDEPEEIGDDDGEDGSGNE